MNRFPLAIASVTTLDSTITTVASYSLPDAFQGSLDIELSGEKANTPTDGYYYSNTYTVSCESGVATIQATGDPTVLDPVSTIVTVTVDTLGTSVRLRVEGPDETWNWVGKINGTLHFRIPDGTLAYYDPAVASAQTPYQDFVWTGTELLIDGDMEMAGVVNWPATGGVATKDTTAPLYAGTQHLRLTANGGAACEQIVLTVGARYLCTGAIRTKNVAGVSGYVTLDGVIPLGMVTNQPNWTAFVGSGMATVTNYRIFKTGLVAGSFADFDSLSCKRVPIVTQSDSLITGGTPLIQPGAANTRPTYLNSTAAVAQGITGACWQYDGVGQYWNTGFIPPADAWTAGGWFWFPTVAAGVKHLFNSVIPAPFNACELYRNGTALIGYNNTTAVPLTHPTALTALVWHHIMFGHNGTTQTLWLDGVPASNASATATTSGLPLYVMAQNANGVPSAYCDGYTGKLLFCNRLLTDAEVLSNYYSTFRS